MWSPTVADGIHSKQGHVQQPGVRGLVERGGIMERGGIVER